MGVKSVTSLQYNENDLVEADVNVSIEDNSFVPVHRADKMKSNKPLQPEEILRQRTVSKATDEQKIVSKVTDAISANGVDLDCKEVKSSRKNPINWFGILVPQSLKQCQGHFQKATDCVCAIATLKAKYVECLDRYQVLLKEKQLLLDESFEKLEIES